jgi:HD superfamily phosphohydrolase
MALAGDFEVVRDPLWNNIRIDARALGVVDSAPFQRLRYVRQLGHAYLVYPGATHTRFEHALGAYHLARRSLGLLRERGELEAIEEESVTLAQLAALLHDIGHYPFSHALEEAGLPSHETLALRHFGHPELAGALERYGIRDIAARLSALITGKSDHPLQGLIAGPLDLDKLEYLTRDARMCGVPYGTVDVDRLLHSLTVTEEGIGIHEKGVSALESVLFAKYQMYRNVYWHHAIRSATAMFKRLIRMALDAGHLDTTALPGSTDESLMERVRDFAVSPLPARLRRRQLYKRAADIPAGALPTDAGAWISTDPELLTGVEDRLAEQLRLAPGGILLDFPAKPAMLSVDLPLRLRDGRTARLDAPDRHGLLGIQGVAEQLHASARRLRLFVADPVKVEEESVRRLAARSAEDVAGAVAAGRPLL